VNPVATILWEAAADVEQRGVVGRAPKANNLDETCAYLATQATNHPWREESAADNLLALSVGIAQADAIPDWNDAQPSRAVVAAAMRDAAQLAEWAGDHLLGRSA
jgi:hypothetical protein